MRGDKAKADKKSECITRDYTIHVSKLVHKVQFKKRAPRAIQEIKKFAQKAMGTTDVRIDTGLNKFIWSKGVRYLPTRVRVRLTRRKNDEEDAEEKMYTVAQYVPVDSFKGLTTETVEELQLQV
ncbi:uncharacterized protein LOC128884045 [Hylaeus volcanicus]|uniref:uncharacterized protein LOC128884045 n=1 Tax=Hylaeus volcanicus TaxID=313075 RepID=UPI0023B7A268|nr:uncharacterized protein LOC128884045 [Hylaeus volcanicus]